MAERLPSDVEVVLDGPQRLPDDVEVKVEGAPQSRGATLSDYLDTIATQTIPGYPLAREAVAGDFGPKTSLGAGLRGFGHGASFGFTDELQGLVGAQDELGGRLSSVLAGPNDPWSVRQTRAQMPLLDALNGRYREERDAARHDEDVAAAEHPVIHGSAEMAGAVATPNPFKGLGGGKLLGRLAGYAGMGELAGAGMSRAEDAGDIASDAERGGGFGLAAGAGGEALGVPMRWIAGKARGLRDLGASRAESAIASKATKDMASERGRLGGFSAAGLRSIERAEEIASSSAATPEQQAAARAWLQSPEAIALKQTAFDNVLAALPGQRSQIEQGRAAYEVAAAAAEPSAVQAETAKYLNGSVLTNDVLPRAEKYASRMAPGAIGEALGGAHGANLAGAIGAPGTALGNFVRVPRVQFRAGQAGDALFGGAASLTTTPALPAAMAGIDQRGGVDSFALQSPAPKQRAYSALEQYLGLVPETDEDTASQHFRLGTSDPNYSPAKR